MAVDETTDRLAAIRHLALDMDGTIYKGGTLFECTHPFLAQVRELGISYTFLTNNSSRSARDYLAQLKKYGLDVQPGQLLTSGLATIEYLKANHPDFRHLYILGTESLQKEFREAGYTTAGELATDEPDAVIVSFDTTLVYERLCMAGYWIGQGKPYIATNPDRICPTDRETLLVDCGAFCKCLESATGRSPDVVLGKPHPAMLQGILTQHQLDPHELAMVGDRLYTDLAMARVSGAVGVLVLTGETTQEDMENYPDPPDVVVSDIGELGRLLQNLR
ncbi:MAG: HAD-IIA family hydrolase [Pirellulales bacterium]|nr:HAD-IIA family hydrolase [Pirellulales bacterium]